jgi:toxin ParE1/3/4
VTHRVTIRPSAEADIDGLYEFIARDSPPNAVEFTRRIREHCHQLSLFPERGSPHDDLEPGLRVIGFERRVAILFRVLDTEVEIVRILYGGRELSRLFKKR